MRPPETIEETSVTVECDRDIVVARTQGRAMATQVGFDATTATLIATAISELARNILLYARRGSIRVSPLDQDGCRGLLIVADDQGPGIPDVSQAMRDGYSTSGRLGLGLPGVRRLMDGFEIRSTIGEGTTVKVKKWNK